jgi:hypothetical protein
MMFAVLATGPSMSQAVADAVRGRCRVIAVSDAYKLAPWADALVSSDRAWWRHHKPEFAGRKLSGVPVDCVGIDGIERVEGTVSGSNSGLIALKVAVSMGATRVLLLGYDMGGAHFFGDHPAPLKNTTPSRFEVFKRQFADYRPKGVEIINCTPGSALTCYPTMELEAALASVAQPSLHAG